MEKRNMSEIINELRAERDNLKEIAALMSDKNNQDKFKHQAAGINWAICYLHSVTPVEDRKEI